MSPLQNKYKIGSKEYVYDPELLKFHYHSFTIMSDEEFLEELPQVMHFACFMSFVLKLDHIKTLSDDGIIHELVHLSGLGTKKYTNIKDVRKKFNDLFGDIPKIFDINAKYPKKSGQKDRQRT